MKSRERVEVNFSRAVFPCWRGRPANEGARRWRCSDGPLDRETGCRVDFRGGMLSPAEQSALPTIPNRIQRSLVPLGARCCTRLRSHGIRP